jgi:hypothetical protein
MDVAVRGLPMKDSPVNGWISPAPQEAIPATGVYRRLVAEISSTTDLSYNKSLLQQISPTIMKSAVAKG